MDLKPNLAPPSISTDQWGKGWSEGRRRRGDAREKMWKEIRDRESGSLLPRSFSRRISSSRIAALDLSNRKDFISPHHRAINSLQIDTTERRYLLSGASDGSAAVFDAQCETDYEGGNFVAKHRSLFCIDKRHINAHKFAISSAIWYPIDTGLFITASFDHHVKVWDTNAVEAVMDFKMPGKVYRASMSEISTTHALIATGSSDVHVRLCDIVSGAFTHTLSGHRDGVMSLEWSSSNEFMLMTGGLDGAIRFWDIRRAGCFLILDQSKSQLGTRPPLLNKTELPTKPKKRSFENRAVAHYGAITGLRATSDGMYLLSSGSDSRLRLWDIESGRNTMVNYESMRLQNSKPLQFSVSSDSSLVFIPCMSTVKAYDLWSGMLMRTFRGHYELVNCCYFNSQDQELYTGSNDRQILVWSPSIPSITKLDEGDKRGPVGGYADEDNWSD